MIVLALVLAFQTSGQQAAPRLVLTGVGRFAVFADAMTVSRDGDVARIRALQLAEPGFAVGETPFLGGWSWWRIDCVARTADRLDFASLRADRTEGPSTPDPSPAQPISPGGDTDELAAVACGPAPPHSLRLTLEQAIAVAHRELGEP